MYHVSAQGVDERMINVHYYYYLGFRIISIAPSFITCQKSQVIFEMPPLNYRSLNSPHSTLPRRRWSVREWGVYLAPHSLTRKSSCSMDIATAVPMLRYSWISRVAINPWFGPVEFFPAVSMFVTVTAVGVLDSAHHRNSACIVQIDSPKQKKTCVRDGAFMPTYCFKFLNNFFFFF